MAYRTLNILIKDIEFEICDKKLHDESNYKNIDLFACCNICNKKISYILGVGISDNELQNALKNDLFNEICEFTHEKHTFQGSFIDALIYIQKQFKGKENG